MNRKKPQEWWKLPSLIVGGVAALGAVGTVIVKSAAYLVLPAKVEAVESTNAAQDKILDRITVVLEQQQLSEALRVPPFYDTDQHGVTWACDTDPGDCWTRQTWRRVVE